MTPFTLYKMRHSRALSYNIFEKTYIALVPKKDALKAIVVPALS